MRPAVPARAPSATAIETNPSVPIGADEATERVREPPSTSASTPSGSGAAIENSRSSRFSGYGYVVSRVRSSSRDSPGSTSSVAPVNTGGWFSRGVTVIGSTRVAMRPSGSSAPSPSVTSNAIDAGPKY